MAHTPRVFFSRWTLYRWPHMTYDPKIIMCHIGQDFMTPHSIAKSPNAQKCHIIQNALTHLCYWSF